MQCQLSRHVIPVPYVSFNGGAAGDLSAALDLSMDWQALVGQRALARFRANLLELGHRSGRRTRAQVQCCVACFAHVPSVYVHCLLECSRFSATRRALVQVFGSGSWMRLDLMKQLVGLRPGETGYLAMLALVSDIERVEREFWICQS